MNENSKTLPNMSLTAFKALVGQQPVYVELVERYGARGDKIPEKLRGKRRIVKARSYGFDIAIAGSLYETSRLEIRRASLCKIADALRPRRTSPQCRGNGKDGRLACYPELA